MPTAKNRKARRAKPKPTEKPYVPPTSITIAGKTWPVTLPAFAERDELATGHHGATTGMTVLRVSAAAIGLCTPIGRAVGADYTRQHRCDVLSYGGAVYSWLRGKGADIAEIGKAGQALVTMCAHASFPREAEVATRADFTPPNGAGRIA